MKKPNKIDRKTFLKSAGVAVFGAAFGSWTTKARADIAPASIVLGHITDTFFPIGDDPRMDKRKRSGWLYGYAYAIADDLMDAFGESGLGAPDMVLQGGNLTRSGKPDQASAALDWLRLQAVPVRMTMGKGDLSAAMDEAEFLSMFSGFGFGGGTPYYFHDEKGFHFVHLYSPLKKNTGQFKWLLDDLNAHKGSPVVIVSHGPLDNTLAELASEHDGIVLALSGATFANSAAFHGGVLWLGTCSPVTYPCGARIVKIDVGGGKVSVASQFVQTRRTELVEESFYRLGSPKNVDRLGEYGARPCVVDIKGESVAPVRYDMTPALVPRSGGDSEIVLAVISDTHLCLDKYISPDSQLQNKETREEYDTSGHFTEEGSKAIYADLLDQVARGVHRVEFYDEVFDRAPDSEANYIDAPVDALLLNGDLSEHSTIDESQLVLDGLDSLPERLRRSAYVTPGNHDYHAGGFIEKDSTSSRKPFVDFYKNYLSPDGSTYYTVELADWLTLIVLDSCMPTHSGIGMRQEQMDWFEDQIEKRWNQCVIVACHHPIYPVSQVPRVMTAYLRARSHFTPNLTSTRVWMQGLFARHNNVRLVISGHYHGTCVDQYRKATPVSSSLDEPFTTHIQVPCTVEYPNGYRLFRISRSKREARIEYISAYTRLSELRAWSGRAKLFSIMGADIKVPKKYKGAQNAIDDPDNILRLFDKFNPIDIADMNIRGYKDGTAHRGRGNSTKNNINGKIVFGI